MARTFMPAPRAIAVVCLDGSADDYLDAAMRPRPHAEFAADERQRMARLGARRDAHVSPTSTTPQSSPAYRRACTAIGGNFFFDPETQQEVMMNSARFSAATPSFLMRSGPAGKSRS
jgi:phosphonoacetate hydrolase